MQKQEIKHLMTKNTSIMHNTIMLRIIHALLLENIRASIPSNMPTLSLHIHRGLHR